MGGTFDIKRLGKVQEQAALAVAECMRFTAAELDRAEKMPLYNVHIHAVIGNRVEFVVNGVQFSALVTIAEPSP